jgi:ferredoxin-type protein NapH
MSRTESRRQEAERATRNRARLQLVLWLVLPVVIIFGWHWPYLGFFTPLAMFTGMIGGLFRGRWTCGWICPRGSFLELIMGHLSLHRGVPAWLRGYTFRWAVFAGLMGLMVGLIALHPGSAAWWGWVFVLMCTVTTGIAVVLAVVYEPRAWCGMCPVGTFAGRVGGQKTPLRLGPDCEGCRECEKVCPLALEIARDAPTGQLQSNDCVRCYECVKVCPRGCLTCAGRLDGHGRR